MPLPWPVLFVLKVVRFSLMLKGFTADPRIVPNAKKIQAINYEEMLELASSGSKVMQTRAVEFAQKHNILLKSVLHFQPNPELV